MGKILIATALAGALAVVAANIAIAAPLPPPDTAASNIIDAAVRCGSHAHYVRGHRDRGGHYILGHCVRNRRGRP